MRKTNILWCSTHCLKTRWRTSRSHIRSHGRRRSGCWFPPPHCGSRCCAGPSLRHSSPPLTRPSTLEVSGVLQGLTIQRASDSAIMATLEPRRYLLLLAVAGAPMRRKTRNAENQRFRTMTQPAAHSYTTREISTRSSITARCTSLLGQTRQSA